MTSLESPHFFLIYKITNNVNNKCYIGKHITKKIDDGYMGSGKLLRQAIIKYGSDNFTKEILFYCGSEAEMNAKEAELVTEEFCLRKDTYNLCVGGQGGFSYINRNGLSVSNFTNPETHKKAKQNSRNRNLLLNEDELSSRRNKNIDNLKKSHIKFPNGTFKGKVHTSETKNKMLSANKKSTKIEINGVEYPSISKASRELNIRTSVIISKLKSDVYTNFLYK